VTVEKIKLRVAIVPRERQRYGASGLLCIGILSQATCLLSLIFLTLLGHSVLDNSAIAVLDAVVVFAGTGIGSWIYFLGAKRGFVTARQQGAARYVVGVFGVLNALLLLASVAIGIWAVIFLVNR
jgi:hypothetical protein